MPAPDVTESASSTVAGILAKFETDPKNGLSAAQLQERLKKYGPNALAEEKKSALSAFLAYFWGPIPWMIEAAALMALIVRDWGDFTIIASLLLFNALLGFWEEHEASNALAGVESTCASQWRVAGSRRPYARAWRYRSPVPRRRCTC
jgi:H+-transporting ATPase